MDKKSCVPGRKLNIKPEKLFTHCSDVLPHQKRKSLNQPNEKLLLRTALFLLLCWPPFLWTILTRQGCTKRYYRWQKPRERRCLHSQGIRFRVGEIRSRRPLRKVRGERPRCRKIYCNDHPSLCG